MSLRVVSAEVDNSTGSFRRALRYAFYDWTREMPRSRRLLAWIGILMQGYAIYAGITRSLVWPLRWPMGWALYFSVWLLYLGGSGLMNAMLTSEFIRKTQLEADQIAARQIQQTLHPERVEAPPGYEVETFYAPIREVGGDYFDVIDLPGGKTLFALADVSGKGMAAALLSANIQALVRSFAGLETDPLALTRRMNEHLCRYTPKERFATAVFVVLERDSGSLTYVNAGHNPPLVFGSGATNFLGATGMPLGLWSDAAYEVGNAIVPPDGGMILYTDGLTDSIAGNAPEERLRRALAESARRTMENLRGLVNPKLNADDVTILVVARTSVAPIEGSGR